MFRLLQVITAGSCAQSLHPEVVHQRNQQHLIASCFYIYAVLDCNGRCYFLHDLTSTWVGYFGLSTAASWCSVFMCDANVYWGRDGETHQLTEVEGSGTLAQQKEELSSFTLLKPISQQLKAHLFSPLPPILFSLYFLFYPLHVPWSAGASNMNYTGQLFLSSAINGMTLSGLLHRLSSHVCLILSGLQSKRCHLQDKLIFILTGGA